MPKTYTKTYNRHWITAFAGMTASPLQMARVAAAAATKQLVEPYLVDRRENSGEKTKIKSLDLRSTAHDKLIQGY